MKLITAFVLVTIAVSVLVVSGCAGEPSSQETAGESHVQITEIGTGSFPRWSQANDLITYTDKLNDRYEVFTMKPDGTDIKCLTAGVDALQGCGNRGQSHWHPNGEYIVFHAENSEYPRIGYGASARPGWGRNFNVWIMTADGENFWQITDYPENWAVMQPQFSHDGHKIYWCEEYSMEKYPNGKEGDVLLPGDNPTGPPFGHPGAYHTREQFTYRQGEEMLAWRVVFADISFGLDGPELSNERKLDPPEGYTLNEGNGFTPEDDGFIGCYSVLEETGGRAYTGELFTCDLDGALDQRITQTVNRHDEDPCYSPDGSLIAFKETKGIVGYEDDIYLVRAGGTQAIRLTHFAEPGYPEYDPIYRRENPDTSYYEPSGVQITEMCFSPDGRSLVFGHCRAEEGSLEALVDIPSYLYILAIPEEYLP